MSPQSVYADLEIRILELEEAGYPVEITLNSEQEFPRGHLRAGVLPWVESASPQEDGRRLYEWLLADDDRKRAWRKIDPLAPANSIGRPGLLRLLLLCGWIVLALGGSSTAFASHGVETSPPAPRQQPGDPPAALLASIQPPMLPPAPLVIGYSTQGRSLEAYRFGHGRRRLVLIGGIHGSEWNTILLAYQAVDFFSAHPEAIPPDVTLVIIPAANPDGQARALGHDGRFTASEVQNNAVQDGIPTGRLNARGVDLNRNWPCNWSPVGHFGRREVSGGRVPFSEPETRALAAFLTRPPADGVIFWHSAAAGVYAGGCKQRFAPSDALGKAYARGSGYPFQQAFTSYPITGDATDWLSTQGIPAVVVELSDHTHSEWKRNLAGIQASLGRVGQ